jgi:BolA family transcriptional regulator, general stress-responsive regulator
VSTPGRPKGEHRSAQHDGAPVGVSAERVRAALAAALAPSSVEVQDDSHLHAGHAGAKEGRHFTVRITSSAFEGRNRVARHRLVYDALQALIAEGIHALAIDARAPGDPPR